MAKKRSPRKSRKKSLSGLAFETFTFGFIFAFIGIALNLTKLSGFASLFFIVSMLCIALGVVLLLLHHGVQHNNQSATKNNEFASNPNLSSAALPGQAYQTPLANPPVRPTEWSAQVLQTIEWRRFEALVEAFFQQSGFRTESQSHGADEGIDIWLYPDLPDAKPVNLVQCKHWYGKRIGVDKVRELRGVLAHKNIERGQFVTSSSFTPDAIAFAQENQINLIDAQALLARIKAKTPEQQTALLNVALEGEYWRPTCVNCGVKMVSRTPKKGGANFWGCAGYPRCKHMMNLRSA